MSEDACNGSVTICAKAPCWARPACKHCASPPRPVRHHGRLVGRLGRSETMVVAAAITYRLTLNPLEPAATMTAYIVQVAWATCRTEASIIRRSLRRGSCSCSSPCCLTLQAMRLKNGIAKYIKSAATPHHARKGLDVWKDFRDGRLCSSSPWWGNLRLMGPAVCPGNSHVFLAVSGASNSTAWIGTILVMLVTALAAIPLGSEPPYWKNMPRAG